MLPMSPIQRYLISRQERGYSHITVSAYQKDLEQLSTWLAGQQITCWEEVTCEHLTAYVQVLHTSMKPRSVSRKRSVFRSFFRSLRAWNVLPDDPTTHLEKVHVPKTAPRTHLTAEQVRDLLLQVDTQATLGMRDLALLQTLGTTKLRATALTRLNLNDVDQAHRRLIECPENAEKTIAWSLTDEAWTSLMRYREIRLRLVRDPNEPALFVNCFGERLTRQGIWQIVQLYAQRADLAEISSPESLRGALLPLLSYPSTAARTRSAQYFHNAKK